MSNLNELLKTLLQSDLDFVIVDGFAAVLHGSSQLTRDIDLCLALDPATIEKLRALLKDLQPHIRTHPKKLSFLEHPSSLENVKNLYLQTDLGPIDLLSEIKGVGPAKRVAARAESFEFFGETCKVISLEDLIQAKYAMGRPKDIATAKELEAILAH